MIIFLCINNTCTEDDGNMTEEEKKEGMTNQARVITRAPVSTGVYIYPRLRAPGLCAINSLLSHNNRNIALPKPIT